MKRSLLIAAALLPALAACAGATPRRPEVGLPAAYEAPSRGAALPAAALQRWWTLYDDPQLTALVDEALANGFDVRTAAARLDQARAVRDSLVASLLPTGSLNGAATRQHSEVLSGGGGSGFVSTGSGFLVVGDSDTLGANFNVNWELDVFGRVRAGQRIARADFKTAEYTYEATRWALAAQVAEALFQARGLAIQLQDAQETLRIQQELYRVAKAKADHGLTPGSDAAQTQANVLSSQAQVENLTAELDAARRQLLLLVGRGADPLASLPTPAVVGAPPPVPATIPGDLLVRRPDVREAQWKLASAAGSLTVAQLALFPKFTLAPGLGLSKAYGVTTGSWSLGVDASVPILDIPKLLAQLRGQKAVSEQAVLAYEQTVQAAYGDADTALRNLGADTRRVDLLRAAETNAQAAYEAKRIGYSRGFNDLQVTLTAESGWRQARVARAQAEVTLLERSVQVFKAIGGGWTVDAPGSVVPAKGGRAPHGTGQG